MSIRTIIRDAITGRFVTRRHAEENPDTTTVERRRYAALRAKVEDWARQLENAPALRCGVVSDSVARDMRKTIERGN